MAEYNVLWIDDEPDKQDGFFDIADMKDIILHNCKTSREGIEELSKKINFYDAVILDAKGYNDSEDEVPKLTGLLNSIIKIERLSPIRKIPYFIFTGQKDVVDNTDIIELLEQYPLYQKGVHNDKLFQDIKEAAKQNEETQIKHEHERVFEALSKYNVIEHFEDDATETLTKILIAIKKGDVNFSDKEQFTQIRRILEMMFRVANKKGLLHDKCILNNKVNLSDSSLFMAGEDTHHSDVRCSKKHFPKLIADLVKNILFITGSASHTEEEVGGVSSVDKQNLQEYRNTLRTPYFLFSLTLQLIDIVIWFNDYCDLNQDIEKNKSYWEDIPWINGTVTNVSRNNWGTFQDEQRKYNASIPKGLILKNHLRVNEKVKVKIKKENEIRFYTKEIKRN
ncbi:hypothetical protein [Saccharicrinis fermentans]|uniref:Uncharacterized protein n=1 Tax=Saccharicrinis fermentans DSM 9555 = JCM 21142 TaxID=869213 RepID=W7YTG5_9BACT|nr:hypothetical protein [Saccharicrinis fermentans]GAF05734.1 hypothetical protein JCM21142_104484 [Saccharicrinis fermentans DSM 9555 = JCM 21142]